MVVANTSRGLTLAFDLTVQDDLSSILDLLASGQVTALSIARDGTHHTLTAPRGFRNPAFGVAAMRSGDTIVGERVFVQAGDVRVSLSSTFAGSVVRTDLVRTGAMRYNPLGKGRRG